MDMSTTTGSCYVSKGGIKLEILLPQPPEHKDKGMYHPAQLTLLFLHFWGLILASQNMREPRGQREGAAGLPHIAGDPSGGGKYTVSETRALQKLDTLC